MELSDYINSNPARAIPFALQAGLDIEDLIKDGTEATEESAEETETVGGPVDAYDTDCKGCTWYIGRNNRTIMWR